MSSLIVIVVVAAAVAVLGLASWITLRLQRRLDELGHRMGRSQEQTHRALAERLERLHRATGEVVALSAGIDRLSRALATPRGRGAFGELSLSQVLSDLLPAEYVREQWPVEDGAVVDAAILLKEGALPIDAKFTVMPPDQEDDARARRDFQRAVLARGREIAHRYVRPPRTLELAFMYVPAESIYSRIISDRPLHQKLLDLKVVPASPNTLYAFLQAVAIGLRGMKIEERAREILDALSGLRRDMDRFGEHFRKLGTHLDNARAQYLKADQESLRLRHRLDALQQGDSEDEATPAISRGA